MRKFGFMLIAAGVLVAAPPTSNQAGAFGSARMGAAAESKGPSSPARTHRTRQPDWSDTSPGCSPLQRASAYEQRETKLQRSTTTRPGGNPSASRENANG